MKKLIAMVLVLCGLAAAGSAFAETPFLLPRASEVEGAPSYEVIYNVSPASESTTKDGDTKHVYTNVSDEQFLDFGIKLAERGYSVDRQQVVDGEVQVDVVKDDLRFKIIFHQQSQRMSLVYPAGVMVEKPALADPFADFIPFELGETIDLKVANLTFTEFHPNEEINVYIERDGSPGRGRNPFYTWIEGSFTNTDSTAWYFDLLFTDSRAYFDVKLHYVNSKGHYRYMLSSPGGLTEHGIVYATQIRSIFKYRVPSLATSTIGMPFYDVPEAARTADDGYLAITIESDKFPEVRYVLYLRKP